jgi:hypothetical protein
LYSLASRLVGPQSCSVSFSGKSNYLTVPGIEL